MPRRPIVPSLGNIITHAHPMTWNLFARIAFLLSEHGSTMSTSVPTAAGIIDVMV
jgi:hypothetical protein